MSIQIEEKTYPKKLIIIVAVCLLAAAALITSFFAVSDIAGVSKGTSITIDEGMTTAKAAERLKEDGVIKFPLIFRLISRQLGYDTKIRPGICTVSAGMSYKEILESFTTAKAETVKVVIPEGYEAKEIAERLSELVSESEFYKAMSLDYDYDFLKNLPEREVPLEGYLFPATYEFEKGISAEEIINTMLSAFDKHFTDEYKARANELGKSIDEIVTLASIIERESNSAEDRAKVAGVFYNRLKKNMKLQSCATIQYILKERKTVLSTEDTKIESPYNTYLYSGLPKGPISSPGEECIKAALYPEETDALYFVLGPDGKHIFSKTYEEHLKAKNGK
ncbi:MAG: endolytic transglycosylase MltG [Clostridia bacterium]|nr:endolytic transglycosylase MltG [Clostridia bacterium]